MAYIDVALKMGQNQQGEHPDPLTCTQKKKSRATEQPASKFNLLTDTVLGHTERQSRSLHGYYGCCHLQSGDLLHTADQY